MPGLPIVRTGRETPGNRAVPRSDTPKTSPRQGKTRIFNDFPASTQPSGPRSLPMRTTPIKGPQVASGPPRFCRASSASRASRASLPAAARVKLSRAGAATRPIRPSAQAARCLTAASGSASTRGSAVPRRDLPVLPGGPTKSPTSNERLPAPQPKAPPTRPHRPRQGLPSAPGRQPPTREPVRRDRRRLARAKPPLPRRDPAPIVPPLAGAAPPQAEFKPSMHCETSITYLGVSIATIVGSKSRSSFVVGIGSWLASNSRQQTCRSFNRRSRSRPK